MSVSSILSNSIVPIASIAITFAIMRTKGPKQSKFFALFLAVAGIIFLAIGLWGLITRQWEHTTAAAAVGIVFILFGTTCFLGTHIHMEIFRLKQKLGKQAQTK